MNKLAVCALIVVSLLVLAQASQLTRMLAKAGHGVKKNLDKLAKKVGDDDGDDHRNGYNGFSQTDGDGHYLHNGPPQTDGDGHRLNSGPWDDDDNRNNGVAGGGGGGGGGDGDGDGDGSSNSLAAIYNKGLGDDDDDHSLATIYNKGLGDDDDDHKGTGGDDDDDRRGPGGRDDDDDDDGSVNQGPGGGGGDDDDGGNQLNHGRWNRNGRPRKGHCKDRGMRGKCRKDCHDNEYEVEQPSTRPCRFPQTTVCCMGGAPNHL